jgi:hypothetical protein
MKQVLGALAVLLVIVGCGADRAEREAACKSAIENSEVLAAVAVDPETWPKECKGLDAKTVNRLVVEVLDELVAKMLEES